MASYKRMPKQATTRVPAASWKRKSKLAALGVKLARQVVALKGRVTKISEESLTLTVDRKSLRLAQNKARVLLRRAGE